MSPSLPPEATPRTTQTTNAVDDAHAVEPALNGADGAGDAYDALADLFLGDTPGSGAGGTQRHTGQTAGGANGAAEPWPGGAGSRDVVIEGLVLGHLPVLASVWATQYAPSQVSEQTGEPVALVRVREDQTTIELFGASSQVREIGNASLGQAVAAARAAARIWLVRGDEMSEPRLASLEGLDAVTLLTGADDAAVVASYRTVKSLHEQRAPVDGRGPEVRVAIMGSGGPKAEDAACKLSRAAGTFLGTKLKVSVCAAKIGAGRSAVVYKGDTPGRPEEVLESLTAAIRAAGGTARPAGRRRVSRPLR